MGSKMHELLNCTTLNAIWVALGRNACVHTTDLKDLFTKLSSVHHTKLSCGLRRFAWTLCVLFWSLKSSVPVFVVAWNQKSIFLGKFTFCVQWKKDIICLEQDKLTVLFYGEPLTESLLQAIFHRQLMLPCTSCILDRNVRSAQNVAIHIHLPPNNGSDAIQQMHCVIKNVNVDHVLLDKSICKDYRNNILHMNIRILSTVSMTEIAYLSSSINCQ